MASLSGMEFSEVSEESNGTVIDEVTESTSNGVVGAGDASLEVVGNGAEWTFDLRDGISDDMAQAVGEISDGQFRTGFLVPLVIASIGAAYIGIKIGDVLLPFGRTTLGKASGAVLGTLAFDVLSRKFRA